MEIQNIALLNKSCVYKLRLNTEKSVTFKAVPVLSLLIKLQQNLFDCLVGQNRLVEILLLLLWTPLSAYLAVTLSFRLLTLALLCMWDLRALQETLLNL